MTREGFATIPVNLLWQKSDKTNCSPPAVLDAALNHDKFRYSAIRVRNRFALQLAYSVPDTFVFPETEKDSAEKH